MSQAVAQSVSVTRSLLSLVGAIAGLAFYVLAEYLTGWTQAPAGFMAIVTFCLSFFAILLLGLGPLPLGRALAAAGAVAVPAALLMAWVTIRYHDLDNLGEAAFPILAGGLIVFVATPFSYNALDPETRWSDYPSLFTRAWEIVVRYVVAWAFAGVFWGLYFLSNAVLNLVGIGVLENLAEIDPMPPVLTGAVLGLALAVIHEMRHLISPKIVLRLFRLLLPPVALVSAVFVLMVPIRGLSSLTGDWSAGAIVMVMGLALVSLITVSIDRDEGEAASAPVLVWSARGGSVMVLILAALALWAIGLRVGQYGLTPPRVFAGVSGLVLLGYGVLYTVGLLRGVLWRHWVRQANVWMALVSMGLAAAWLSPVLNAESLSAKSQLARVARGDLAADEVDLTEIARDWGHAGERALEAYRDPEHEDHGAMAPLIARLDAGELDPGEPITVVPQDQLHSRLAEVLPILPEGAEAGAAIEALSSYYARQALSGCTEARTPAGAPACIGVMADFDGQPGEELLLLYWQSGRVRVASGGSVDLPSEAHRLSIFDEIGAGGFELAPPRGLELRFGGGRATP